MEQPVLTYSDVIAEAEKPTTRRQPLEIDGKLINVRKYHKTNEKLIEYWTKRNTLGAFINPFERDGAYKGQVEVLIVLGVNRWHSFLTVLEHLPNVMRKMKSSQATNAWEYFASRSKRLTNGQVAKSAKDLDGKIIQNFEQLQRLGGLHQPGFKLKQAHATLDIQLVPVDADPYTNSDFVKGSKGTYYYRLNTRFVSQDHAIPFNNYKGKRKGRPKK